MENISTTLLEQGIGYVRNGQLEAFPIDDARPTLLAKDYGLNQKVLLNTHRAWQQWRNFAHHMLSMESGRQFFRSFLAPGLDGTWGDLERSELPLFNPKTNYFPDAHITRVDYTLHDGKIRLLDPNIMPFGVAPMVAAQELLGISTHTKYLERLAATQGVWTAEANHGNASSLAWLCKRAGITFQFSNELQGEVGTLIRQTRQPMTGTVLTVNAPGIRVYESQLWSALISLGVAEQFGFGIDIPFHRATCTPTFLCKRKAGSVLVAYSFQGEKFQWITMQDFLNLTNWGGVQDNYFIKGIFTSGSHQVTFVNPKRNNMLTALGKTLPENKYFLLQPPQACLVGGERVRIASYFGPDGAHYGSEVTRVPGNNLLAHSGSHAKESYLIFE